MAIAFPYTRYVCPCSDSTPVPLSSPQQEGGEDHELHEDQAFHPHDPRANFSLYPIDHLLFCDECNHPRCPKCWTEEMIYWYCPSCQFEVPSSGVKSDGNRCTRHCYDCPICSGTLSITAISRQSETFLKPGDNASSQDSYMLHCQFCDWSSLDIGVKFAKSTKITEQLNNIWKERTSSKQKEDDEEDNTPTERLVHEDAFAKLSTFYKEQLSDSSGQSNPYSNSPYNSPANLARIMSLYGGLSYNALKKSREKPQPMREVTKAGEGLAAFTADDIATELDLLREMKKHGMDGTASRSQRLAAPRNYDARFTQDLWPVATPLRVRRGKRCRTCRQFIARPEPKVGSMRYKIRLLAVNFIQRLSVRPLLPSIPSQNAAFHLRAEAHEETTLKPHQTHQYVLTVRNPVFESVKITLATPASTPGRVSSRVTILCPSFTVGPAGDTWDEALSAATAPNDDGSRRAAMESLTGSADGDRQPEAGKVWERSRNSTSVILEVIPGALHPAPAIVPKTDGESPPELLREDDDVLEIPIYVRAEWEADVHEAGGLSSGDKKREREAKELAYWCVLGLGRIVES